MGSQVSSPLKRADRASLTGLKNEISALEQLTSLSSSVGVGIESR